MTTFSWEHAAAYSGFTVEEAKAYGTAAAYGADHRMDPRKVLLCTYMHRVLGADRWSR